MFRNDYSELCAKEVLEALQQNLMDGAKSSDASSSGKTASGNKTLPSGKMAQNVGYGLDEYSKKAEDLILATFGLSQSTSAVHFLAGGTQTNMVVISYFLRHYESVICCDTGHINVHETGAVEGAGYKIFAVPNADGKLLASEVEKAVLVHKDEHQVKPKMVYISDTTETGTVYTRQELLALRAVCDKYKLLLFIDGARLGVALTAKNTDVTAKCIGEVADVFYVGGTKNGALFGEAVVIKNKNVTQDFRYHIKNSGAMLAKGFVLGLQFERLFTDDLYFKLATTANETAEKIRQGLKKSGIALVGKSNTNQIFVKVRGALKDGLIKNFGTEVWEENGSETTLRIVTSFATTADDVNELLNYVKRQSEKR